MSLSKTPRSIVLLGMTLVFVLGLLPSHAFAFNNNRVIDDSIFDNVNSMTAGDINAFLNKFPSSCISPNNGFSAIDPNGYNPSNGFLYGGNVSAGQVIYDAAQAYGINPQVLLTTLQKEQSLINGGAGCSTNRYAKAVGYGCPDGGTSYDYSGVNLYTKNGVTYTSVSGVCVNSAAKVGFTQQVIHAAWMLKYSKERSKGNIGWAVIKGNWDNSDDLNATYSGYMTQGCFKRSKYESTCTNYDGYTTIDNTAVHIDTGGTAALYRYTPHFSGNTNFVNLFNTYFGSTLSGQCLTNQSSVSTSVAMSDQRGKPATGNFLINSGSGSGCVEAHTWQAGYRDWSNHIASNLPSIDPAVSYVTYGDVNGDGKDEAILVAYKNTGSGNVEFHVWNPGMQSWQAHWASNFPTSAYVTADDDIKFADLTGRGYDQAVLIQHANTGSGNVEFHVWNPGMQSWQAHIASNYPTVSYSAADDSVSFADLTGRGYDQAVLVAFRNTGSGNVEFHVWNSWMQSWQAHIASNLGAVNPADFSISFNDVNARGYDQAVLIGLHNTGSRNIEFHIWNSWMQSWQAHIASNMQTIP
jgi:hypothetical protein